MNLEQQTLNWLKNHRNICDQLKKITPPKFDKKFIQDLKNHDFKYKNDNNLAKFLKQISILQDSLKINPPIKMDIAEISFLAHDNKHILKQNGIISQHPGILRPSSKSFFYEFRENKSNPYKRKYFEKYRQLYSESALEKTLKNWHSNFLKSVETKYLLYSYIVEKSNIPVEKYNLNQVMEGIKATLNNDYFALAYNEKCPITINIDCDKNLETKKPGLLQSIIYNLANNSFKRAEKLYGKYESFSGGEINLIGQIENNELILHVNQTFDGLDIKDYVKLGCQLEENKPELLSKFIEKDTQNRYKELNQSKYGDIINKMRIGDFTNIVYLPFISEGEIAKDEYSGIGLYGTKQAILQNGGSIEYTLKPNTKKNTNKEGFLIRLPLNNNTTDIIQEAA